MAPRSDHGELEVELTRLMRRARSSQQRIARQVHPDLDVAGYAVLVTIRDLAAAGGGARGADISKALGLHKSTMSRNLATLENLGLIERIPDPDDARARQVRWSSSRAPLSGWPCSVARPSSRSTSRSRATTAPPVPVC